MQYADFIGPPLGVARDACHHALDGEGEGVAVGGGAMSMSPQLLIHDRGGLERVPLAAVLYFKSELKYLTVRTALRSYIFEGSLLEWEQREPDRFLRIHRNALVARVAIRALEKPPGPAAQGWVLRLAGIPEALPVSRRQLGRVRAAFKAAS